MRTPNKERIQFIRAYLRVNGPDRDSKELFEALQDTFAEIKGRSIFKNYDDFVDSRVYYLKTGALKGARAIHIDRPADHNSGLVCPSCGVSLIFKNRN